MKVRINKIHYYKILDVDMVYTHDIYQNGKQTAFIFGVNKLGNHILGTFNSIKRAKQICHEIENCKGIYEMPRSSYE